MDEQFYCRASKSVLSLQIPIGTKRKTLRPQGAEEEQKALKTNDT